MTAHVVTKYCLVRSYSVNANCIVLLEDCQLCGATVNGVNRMVVDILWMNVWSILRMADRM